MDTAVVEHLAWKWNCYIADLYVYLVEDRK